MNIVSEDMNKDHLQTLARDLRKTPPRSPRETLGGFVIGARMLNCIVEIGRAVINARKQKASA